MATASTSEDPDLDGMLDDALAEFDDEEPEVQSQPEVESSSSTLAKESSKASKVEGKGEKATSTDGKDNPNALGDFLKVMNEGGIDGDSELKEQDIVLALQKVLGDLQTNGDVSEEFAKVLNADTANMKTFVDAMQATKKTTKDGKASAPDTRDGEVEDALKSLSEGLKDIPKEEDALKKLLSTELDKLDIFKEGEPSAEFSSVVDNIIGTMMSKEYLYPAVKEITEKFPDFLKKSEGKATEAEMQQYQQQYKCFQELCAVLEKDKETPETNKEIIDLMQKMQSYGPPPTEIMSGLLPGVEFDKEGMPKLPGMGPGGGSGEECVLI